MELKNQPAVSPTVWLVYDVVADAANAVVNIVSLNVTFNRFVKIDFMAMILNIDAYLDAL